jgi:hypothetical protein
MLAGAGVGAGFGGTEVVVVRAVCASRVGRRCHRGRLMFDFF